MSGSKRPRPGTSFVIDLSPIKRRCALSDKLRQELQALYSNVPESLVWDTSKVTSLICPGNHAAATTTRTYAYVGRAKSKQIFERMVALEAGQRMQLLGARGSGKSMVISTIAGYLIGSGKKQVVYLCVKRLIENPYLVLLDALLVACGPDAGLLTVDTFEDLLDWCTGYDKPLLFVVDDWDQFEQEPKLEKQLIASLLDHILVKVSSVNSRERHVWTKSDKAHEEIFTEFLDGPYSCDEFQTWMGQSSLKQEQLQLQQVYRLTGFMPRLLKFYEQVGADEKSFMSMIQTSHTDKLWYKFIANCQKGDELRDALKLVIQGELSPRLEGKVDFTCFYKDEKGSFHLLSPYLQAKATEYIMDKQCLLESRSRLVLNDIWTWAMAVRSDCTTSSSRDPARVGWNVEALVISVVKFQRRLLDTDFQFCKTYARGGELQVLATLTPEELVAGVLLVPEAFDEKAVDVVCVKLNGEKLIIAAVQITVAQWKAKAKKGCHEAWSVGILPKWIQGLSAYTVESKYYYVMPHSVKLDDVPASAAGIKRLGAIHDCLKEFDNLLQLPEPAEEAKPSLVSCSGKNRNGAACSNSSRQNGGDYYCWRHESQRNK